MGVHNKFAEEARQAAFMLCLSDKEINIIRGVQDTGLYRDVDSNSHVYASLLDAGIIQHEYTKAQPSLELTDVGILISALLDKSGY